MNGAVLYVTVILSVTARCLTTGYSASALNSRGNHYFHRLRRQSCGSRDFRCNNGACIDSTLICDGATDCPDGSDETSRTCLNTIVCPSYAFRCDYGGCVDADAKCNGKRDCADGSDERGCPGGHKTPAPSFVNKCKSGQFRCNSGQCIDIFVQCDGNKDCNDGSDETRETCGTFSCPGFAFRCAYGACIDGDGRCNGVAQCADASDESPDICGRPSKDPLVTTTITTTTTSSLVPPPQTQCILPEQPTNGKYQVGGCQGTNCPAPGSSVPFAFLTYSCNAGFTITGSQTAYCQGGAWLSQPPTCSKVACSPLESISRDITCTLNREDVICVGSMPGGTVAEIKCKPFYHQVPELSSYQTMCGANGQWSRPLTNCIPECGIRNPEGVPFVSNGVRAKFGEFPWHVGIYQMSDGVEQQICGGTLISSRTIISAAHCFYDDANERAIDKSEYKVLVGKYFRDFDKKNKYMQEGQIENIILHDRFKGRTWQYESDIAIINLKVEINFNMAVRPICMDRERKFENLQLSDGTVGAVVGWGVNENMEPSPELVTAYLPYVDFKKCYDTVPESLRPYLRKDKFCAGHLNGTSVCPGDSGGGLAFENKSELGSRWYLQGIVSLGVPPRGADKCFTKQYSAFTRVGDYYDFIDKNMIR